MKKIGREELRQWIEANRRFILIDALPEESFAVDHLPGAYNVSEEDSHFEDKVEDIMPDKSEPVVVYSANSDGKISPRAAKRLELAGYNNIYDYEAGKEDWQKAGYKISGKNK